MSGIFNVLQMHLKNRFSWIFLPLIIVLLFAFGSNLILAFFVEVPIQTGAIVSLYVYMLFLGIMIVSDTLPFALGFGLRRTDYVLGTMVMLIGVSLFFALFAVAMMQVETYGIKGWGVELEFFYVPYIHDGYTIFEQIWISFSAITYCFLEGLIISCLYYRFGRNGVYGFLIALIVPGSIASVLVTHLGGWSALFGWIGQFSAFQVASGFIPVTVGLAIVSYVLLLRATVS